MVPVLTREDSKLILGQGDMRLELASVCLRMELNCECGGEGEGFETEQHPLDCPDLHTQTWIFLKCKQG